MRLSSRTLVPSLAGALAATLATLWAAAQISVRPDDPSGLSLRERRVRLIHSVSAEVPGTSMHLQQSDPWLAFQRGRSYFFHEWGREDGVFAVATSRFAAATTTSCGMCHNLPFRSPGAGGNTAEPIGHGRNAPHLFGAGLIEMIGDDLRRQLLVAFDTNRNGYLDVPAETAGKRALLEATAGNLVDYGALEDLDGDRRPDLNGLFQVVYVDAQGRALRRDAQGRARRLGDSDLAGYDVLPGVFASSAGDHQIATLRMFQNGVLRTIMGITADDPTCFQGAGEGARREPERVWAERSNAGAVQPNPELLPTTLEALRKMTPLAPGTMSEGEVDLVEWYLLNHPAPALGRQDERTRRGRALLGEMGCASCHVADWQIRAADPATGFAGDRRFFDLAVAWNEATGRLEGRLRPLARQVADPAGPRPETRPETRYEPLRGGFLVEGVFSDFRHHDLGPRFHEHFYARGKLFPLKRFRTPPLWGVGSTAPYGHDGASATLDDVIRRHGGEAESSTAAYLAAPAADREALLAFLDSLVLYQPDVLPADLDGDGRIADPYQVAGLPMGPERFQPELLFRVPPRYRGWTLDDGGERYFSYQLLNLAEAYGEGLAGLIDQDRDGLPDLAEPSRSASLGKEGAADSER
ncbi:MAG TPA: di-heme oxidoredictase family protein [Thermoanaerobaculia bacterium]|nr:di-heme oxidoredictase family protein [Thermoanaerobaculia bacterium]